MPLHAELPLPDQELALAPPAAASSLTFPECDTVICLGTCNNVRLHQDNSPPSSAAITAVHPHRTMGSHDTMGHTWISQADAIQRAGRAGRIRAGTVYRLYPQELFPRLPNHVDSPVLQNPLPQVITLSSPPCLSVCLCIYYPRRYIQLMHTLTPNMNTHSHTYH